MFSVCVNLPSLSDLAHVTESDYKVPAMSFLSKCSQKMSSLNCNRKLIVQLSVFFFHASRILLSNILLPYDSLVFRLLKNILDKEDILAKS